MWSYSEVLQQRGFHERDLGEQYDNQMSLEPEPEVETKIKSTSTKRSSTDIVTETPETQRSTERHSYGKAEYPPLCPEIAPNLGKFSLTIFWRYDVGLLCFIN